LEYAGRVADFMEFAELLCLDALHRKEVVRRTFSHRISESGRRGKTGRREFAYAAAWEYAGPGKEPVLHKEPLVYGEVT